MSDTTFQRNLRLTVEYDGSDFVGWQAQDNARASRARSRQQSPRSPVPNRMLRVAGRTDAGVHAVAQICNFRSNTQLTTQRIATGLNAVLPRSISVHRVEDVPLDFDSKRDSQWKRYRYTIYQARQIAAHLR